MQDLRDAIAEIIRENVGGWMRETCRDSLAVMAADTAQDIDNLLVAKLGETV